MSDGEYTVSGYSSKLGIPFIFVVHTYIVTEYAGVQNRYDLFAPFTLPKVKTYHGLIFKNILPAKTGFLIWYRNKKWWQASAPGWRWNTTLVSTISGQLHTPAYKVFKFIENEGMHKYSYFNYYRFVRGPNSNTFTQWVIDQIPECGLTLPWTAWGKGYKK